MVVNEASVHREILLVGVGNLDGAVANQSTADRVRHGVDLDPGHVLLVAGGTT
jgi:hypothetical protein